MEFRLQVANEKIWLKDLSKLSKKELELVVGKIRELKQSPWPGGVQVKRLKNYELADFRLRIGNYRVLFDRDLENGTVTLFRLKHRSKLY